MSDVSKKLSYAKSKFSDEDLEALPMKEASYPYEEVDFSQNSLSVAGLQKVLGLCRRCEKLRILKLYKNDINDTGAKELAKFLRSCTTLEELHLSHNKFTVDGVQDIVLAAEEGRPENMKHPLWIRVEMNDVNNPEKVLSDLEKNHSVCGHDSKRYSASAENKKIHLPYFTCQKGYEPKKGKGKGKERDGGWREKGRDDWYDDSWDAGRKKKWSDRDDGWRDGPSRRDRSRSPPMRRAKREPSPEPEQRPQEGKLKIAGGIFLRAMGAALTKGTKKAAKEEEGEAKRGDSPAASTKKPKNFASGTLSRLGLVPEPKKKKKVSLKPKQQKADGEEASAEEEDDEAGSDVEVLSEAAESQASGSEAAKPNEAEAEASDATGSGDESVAAKEEPRRAPVRIRPASPPPARQAPRDQRSPPRRGGSQPRRGASPPGRGAPRRRSPRNEMRNDRRQGDRWERSPRRGERPRRAGQERPRRPLDGDRRRPVDRGRGGRGDSRRGGGRGAHGVRRRVGDRSRSPRGARGGGREPLRGEGRRGRRRVDAGGDDADRRPVRGTRGTAPRRDAPPGRLSLSPPVRSLSPPVQRRADPKEAARAAASARAEAMIDDLPVPAKKPPRKASQDDLEDRPPGNHVAGVVAARPKGGAKTRSQATVGPPAAREAPARSAAKAKAGAKAPGQGGSDSEYSYTDESEYTEETITEDEGKKAAARPAGAPKRKV